jgi:hypothetical protein
MLFTWALFALGSRRKGTTVRFLTLANSRFWVWVFASMSQNFVSVWKAAPHPFQSTFISIFLSEMVKSYNTIYFLQFCSHPFLKEINYMVFYYSLALWNLKVMWPCLLKNGCAYISELVWVNVWKALMLNTCTVRDRETLGQIRPR